MPVVIVEAVDVGDRDVRARVRVPDASLMRTSAVPGLAEKAVALLPGLARHSCDNDAGVDFARELQDTETPHLLEHVTTELGAMAGSPRSLRADTSWDFERDGRGVFRLRFDYDDDLVVLGALREAVTVIEWLFGRAPDAPDVAAAVARLRELRKR